MGPRIPAWAHDGDPEKLRDRPNTESDLWAPARIQAVCARVEQRRQGRRAADLPVSVLPDTGPLTLSRGTTAPCAPLLHKERRFVPASHNLAIARLLVDSPRS